MNVKEAKKVGNVYLGNYKKTSIRPRLRPRQIRFRVNLPFLPLERNFQKSSLSANLPNEHTCQISALYDQ